jgi:hypothetical protein
MTAMSGLNTFEDACTSAVDGQRSRSPPSRFRAGRYRRGRLAGWRLALRRACHDRLLRRRLACVQLRFERAETIAVLLLQRIEFLTQLIDLLSQRLRVLRLRPQGRRRDQQRTGDGTDVRESQTPHDHSSAAGHAPPLRGGVCRTANRPDAPEHFAQWRRTDVTSDRETSSER